MGDFTVQRAEEQRVREERAAEGGGVWSKSDLRVDAAGSFLTSFSMHLPLPSLSLSLSLFLSLSFSLSLSLSHILCMC